MSKRSGYLLDQGLTRGAVGVPGSSTGSSSSMASRIKKMLTATIPATTSHAATFPPLDVGLTSAGRAAVAVVPGMVAKMAPKPPFPSTVTLDAATPFASVRTVTDGLPENATRKCVSLVEFDENRI